MRGTLSWLRPNHESKEGARVSIVGVMGSGQEPHEEWAVPLGERLAGLGVHLLTGGGGGVMEAVTHAFVASPRPRGGLALGVLPSRDPPHVGEPALGYPNPFVELAVRTHLPARGSGGSGADSRNHINVLTSDVIVALPGAEGTASEIELARRYGRPIVALGPHRGAWPALPAEVALVTRVEDAIAFVLDALR